MFIVIWGLYIKDLIKFCFCQTINSGVIDVNFFNTQALFDAA